MTRPTKNKIRITPLETRLMLDASLGGLVSSLVFAEDSVNASEQSIDPDVTVTGTTTDFDGETLTISTTAGTEDQLTINDEGTAAGQIGFDGTNVSYSGTIIGSITSNGDNGSDLSILLDSNASKASIERLIENITYQNTSDTPTTGRTINVALGSLFSEDISITIVPQNDALTLTTNNTVGVNEGANATITSNDLNITDPDNTNSELLITIDTAPANGQLELTTNAGVAITNFTMDDIINNRVIYVHNDSETTSDSFTFTATDGDATLSTQTFNITVTPVNDALTLDTNTNVTVFQNLSIRLGGEAPQFGNEVLNFNTTGTYTSWNGTVDNTSLQYALVFTTPAGTPNGSPGEVLFESGGSGVGIGLYLNSSYELDFYSSNASNTPRLSSDALLAGTQYAVVVEVDEVTDEIRMHYAEAGSFNWYAFGRPAEKTLTGYTNTDHSGTDSAGVGQLGGGSYGGYNGSVSGTTTFQGTIDSNLIITEFPTDPPSPNTILVSNDIDTSADNIIYTITSDVANGTLLLAGSALGNGDTFTQTQLDFGFLTYANSGGLSDSFEFSVTDGDTVLNANTFNITIDTTNVAPEILTTTTIYDENFEGGASGWNNNTTESSTAFTEFLGRFASNVNVAGNQEIFQTFTLSGTQEYATIEFDFYEIDSWDNEDFYVFIDDVLIVDTGALRHSTYNNIADGQTNDITYTVGETTEVLADLGFRTWTDQIYHFSLTVPTNASTLKVGFGSALNSGTNDEAFGIDNILIKELSSTGPDAQTVSIAEDASNGGTNVFVTAFDPDIGQTLTYSTSGGTGTGIFDINASTGEIRILDNSTLDFETTTSYTLDVNVTDGALSDAQTITINILNVLENTAPTITNGPFSIAEDASNDDDVGTLTFTDPEGDNVSYSITGGNTNSAFKINATTGLIEVNDTSAIDFDSISSYNLSIRITDDNVLSQSRTQTITVNITDIDEAPTFDIETVIETQNAGVLYSADTGNFYRNITANNNFDNAIAFAETQTLNGVEGHLVTITSVEEFNFVRDRVSVSHIWIALSDAGEEGKWIWTAGPEAGTQIAQGNTYATGLGYFENWNNNEPNSGSTRNHALMHSNSRWYDNWPGTNAYDSTIEWEGEGIINNNLYNVNHSAADASDVNIGDSVGFVQAIDPEGDTLNFTIESGNADGIFEIDAATGEIRILDTTNLDASTQDTYTLRLRATENIGGKFGEVHITVKFNDNFTISTNTPLNVNEDSSAVLTTASLNITDPDGIAADTQFRVTTLPTSGQLESSNNPGFQISSFTLDDLQNGRISFVHNGAEVATDSFEFSVTDGGDTLTNNTFNINITAVNDAPIIAANTGATVAENGRVTITGATLNSTDLDDAPAGLTYTATTLTRGHIEVSGLTQTTFTQDDIDNGRVEFVQDGSEQNTASFAFSLADGGEDSAVPVTGTFNLTVTPINDTPTITSNTGASVVEGQGVTITNAMLDTTDPDDSGTGLTYILSGIINGRVELSTNVGVPIINFTQADLDANRVRFIHDGGEFDAQFDVSVTDGGEDSATPDSATFNLTRIPVNDSPIINVNTGSSVNQNSIIVLNNFILEATDPDDSATGLDYTITGTTNGQLELLSVPNAAITTFTQDDIDNGRIVFRHSGPPTTAGFHFSVADGGEDSSVPATGTFALSVDNTNDAPVISTNVAPTVDEGSTTILTTAMLNSFDPDDFGADLNWTANNLQNGIIQVNGTTQNTFTQADLSAGLVSFIHDGSETTTASFDILVADGGEDSAAPATGTFTLNITPVNEGPTLIVNDGAPNVIDLNDYTVDAFDSFQDGQNGRFTGTTISPDGSTLTIQGNAWKNIDIPYTLTSNTVLSFEVFSDDTHEILGIGFDDASGFGGGVFGYQLDGTQTWSGVDQSFNTYNSGDGWVRFDIPIGSDFVGNMTQLVFILDKDAGAQGNEAQFRNINFYEDNLAISVDEGSRITLTNTHINSIDVDDTPTGLDFTVSNLTNGHIEVSGSTQTTFTQDDINNNRVEFVHDGSESLSAAFDISLIDGAEDGTTAQTGSFTFIVNPINDAPTIATNTGASMNEGASLTITTSMFNEGDPDDDGAQLTYTASSLNNGQIEVSGSVQSTFTQDDIDAGRVIFVHDGSETTAASFAISLADGGENAASADTATFSITVTPQNDGSLVTTNTGANVNEGATITITNTMLDSTDPDDTTTQRTYTASSLTNGIIQVNGITQNTFTQDDINNNRVTFTHNDSQTTAASFNFSLADGLEHGATADTGTFNLTVTPINDPVSITTNTGATINEGATLTITSAMLDSADLDDTPDQRTYTASSLLNGHIEVSNITQNTFTQDDINNNRVVFIHDDSQTTAASFAISLADGLENSAVADTDTFNITINPINDQTVLTANTGATVNEGDNVTITATMLNSTDPDDTRAQRTYTASGIQNGHIEVSGLTQNTFTQNDIHNNRVIFVHDDSQTTAASFNFSLVDGLENSTTAVTGTFNLTVTPINDAATITTNTGATLNEGASLTITNTMLNFTDPDDTATDVTYTTSSLLNGHIEVSNVTQNTFTQDDINNNRVVFIHDDSQTTAASFAISLADGLENSAVADTDTFNITINPINDAPIIVTNTGATLLEGGAIALNNTMLNATDVDNTNSGLIYTLTATAYGTFENTNTAATLNIGDTFNQGDIDNGYIRYTHNGGEHTHQNISFTLSDGAIALTAVDFDFAITPINDTPYGITITSMEIDENVDMGTVIGDLNGLDVDLPGDIFTFSIQNDPDNAFSIVGNQLLVNAELDFETSISHSVTIRANDNNGGFIDSLMTIQILDINETEFVPLLTNNNDRGAFDGVTIEEERGLREANALLSAFLSDNDFDQMNAFYGSGNLNQILRENMTSQVRAFMANTGDGLFSESSTESINEDNASDSNKTTVVEQDTQKFTNIRQMLEMIVRYDGAASDNEESKDDEKSEGSNLEFQNLYTQFEDVMTYGEKRLDKLKEVLNS